MSSPKTNTLTAIAMVLALGLGTAPAFAENGVPSFASHPTSNSSIRAGITAFEKGDYAKAAFFQKSALKSGLKKSRKLAAYSNLCAAEGAQGQLEAASKACDAALKLSPNAWTALNNQGVVQWLSGDKENAASSFASAQQAADADNELVRQNALLSSAATLAQAD
ncbi:hypothetical protein MNBD_ALPHA06-1283 [hydrothermal vent metagenome]|uniref:Uncharacterized protein n=1 Tax=hydrothermal vent metagenome TaxID=652676 RepID=A0A3B0RX25_9ZZZZ